MALPNPGEWWYSRSRGAAGQVVRSEDLWGAAGVQLWFPARDRVERLAPEDLVPASQVGTAPPDLLSWQVLAARVQEALADEKLLAPLEGSVLPLPHQIQALARALGGDRVRYLLADEVGLGKTVEAGLVLRELKLRGLVQRTLVVAPKGLLTQWVQEMRLHFQEDFHLLLGDEIRSAARQGDGNPFLRHAQVVCPLDSVKPLERRRGWSAERLAAWNRERFENLLLGAWDLVILDEAHRLAGSTDEVARHRLGLGLAQAAPYLLLLTATPHQGKSDGFHRLLTLLDAEAFPDVGSVTRERVAPYVIRTEKRQAIDSGGRALFTPRRTQMVSVEWTPRHDLQEALGQAVTEYVRWGYNRAVQERRTALGFLMVLMQRLATSSTRAIRRALERRLEALQMAPAEQDLLDPEDEESLDAGEEPEEILDRLLPVVTAAAQQERAEVERLVALARRAEAECPDAKAEALLEHLQRLRGEEADPDLKALVFTEFVATQEMLAEFLQSRGFRVARLNGAMSLEERRAVQEDFRGESQVLVSTDAGGEGLNLQFCHVVVNYDLPWNPMRIEQRIGRVDRIGQKATVQAFNFTLSATVEHRVREVLEEKLRTILREFGTDKASDVLESLEDGADFEDLGARVVEGAEAALRHVEELARRFRLRLRATRDQEGLLPRAQQVDPTLARQVEHHPLGSWLERLAPAAVRCLGGTATWREGAWTLTLPDGALARGVFQRAVGQEGSLTMEHPLVRRLVYEAPAFDHGRPVPVVRLNDLPREIRGTWSLWRVAVEGGGQRLVRALPVYIDQEGRSFRASARQLWDRLLVPPLQVETALPWAQAEALLVRSREVARELGEDLFLRLRGRREEALRREREKRQVTLEAHRRALARVGLATVRRHRERLLQAEEEALNQHGDPQAIPVLEPLVMLFVEGSER